MRDTCRGTKQSKKAVANYPVDES